MPSQDQIEDSYGRLVATLTNGIHVYRFADGDEIGVRTQAGWCNVCKQFCYVENLVTPEQIEADGLSLLNRYSDPPAYIVNLYNETLRGAAQWRLALLTRKSQPRCLECGASDYVLVSSSENWTQLSGGQARRVRIRKAFIHAEGLFNMRHYDTEGRAL